MNAQSRVKRVLPRRRDCSLTIYHHLSKIISNLLVRVLILS